MQTAISTLLRSAFTASVEDAFVIPDADTSTVRGTVLIVSVMTGVVRVGDLLRLQGASHDISVEGIEINRQFVDEAYATETVGLLFRNQDLSHVSPRTVLTRI
ncbi:EF-Tu/IF-2/RF-3 family GTPase [Paucibacter soli]|uniref:EF-Tu/IF-2/RF-3 family GTPase n=1 Tax=Paucibacter soli TaxID=3133433 RepID=UPI0040365D31